MERYHWSDLDNYESEDWDRLLHAVESQRRIINWQAVRVWIGAGMGSILFWYVLIVKVVIPLMNAWSGA